eukprot:2953470-Pleurochrysis_carterae.AAC.2
MRACSNAPDISELFNAICTESDKTGFTIIYDQSPGITNACEPFHWPPGIAPLDACCSIANNDSCQPVPNVEPERGADIQRCSHQSGCYAIPRNLLTD